ncbi:variant erythrocyte surface antigen alpha subunit, putative [Babesia ovis]|uniref:Variant erythrocyte surface antigen alpha subunit, putative n=1 Tax=Babesia ovis TaxID=5869 RepID=A0A9W5WWI7_BABOV|nr:variant erythrocyte surface antigen alpha subunit, putative [Babesia ovis]
MSVPLVRCICSLTRRVPRTLGALVGFFVGAISNSAGNPGNLQKTLGSLPVPGNQKDLVDALRKLGGTGIRSTTKGGNMNGTHLATLARADNAVNDAACFLDPLTGHLYDTVSPVFGMTYVSWIVYLLKHLKQGLEMMYQDFNGINCSDNKCAGSTDVANAKAGKCGTTNGCQPGCHGDKCGCQSMVSCKGVHSVLYLYGFSYAGSVIKKNEGFIRDGIEYTCQNFYTKIREVLNGKDCTNNLLEKLLMIVRQYKYRCRMPFGLYIGVYWSAVMGYLLWSMTFNMDLIHIQSHWRSPRSYLVPVQRLMANESRNVKGVCTIGYFQESGDRLLSLGVSDLYL